MRAHSLRRAIWTANAVLGAGVVAVGAMFFLDVLPSVSDAAFLRPAFAKEAVDRYIQRPNPTVIQTAPVTKDMIELVDRPDYRKRNYWIFSGPLPPPEQVDAPAERKVELPTGLESIGRAKLIVYPAEPGEVAVNAVVLWEFTSKKTGAFKPGQFIVEKGAPERFKLSDVKREPGLSKYRLLYEVFEEGKPVKTGELLTDFTVRPGSGKVRFAEPPKPAAPAPGEAGAVAAAGENGAKSAVVPGSSTEPAPPAPVGTAPEASARDRRGAATVRRVNSSLYEVEFDDERLYDEWKTKKLEDIAQSIQTDEVKSGGRSGLQITGLAPNTPADWFDIRTGDKLISINGQPATTRSDVIRIVQNMPKDTARVTVVIERHGKQITYNIDPRDPRVRRQARHFDDR